MHTLSSSGYLVLISPINSTYRNLASGLGPEISIGIYVNGIYGLKVRYVF
jgi:hypothetical protein